MDLEARRRMDAASLYLPKKSACPLNKSWKYRGKSMQRPQKQLTRFNRLAALPAVLSSEQEKF
jgi:hypothetical protein